MPGLLRPLRVLLLGPSMDKNSYSSLLRVGLTLVVVQNRSAAAMTVCPSTSVVWPMLVAVLLLYCSTSDWALGGHCQLVRALKIDRD